ncbi:MAG: hypothetical protein RLZZ215_1126 [Pseudomonadota bacterium]|jgi:hypothetical protein
MTQAIEAVKLPSEPTHSRRSFLKGLGYVAASVASLPVVSGALSKVQAADFSYGTTPSTNVLARKNRNLYLRQFAASIQFGLKVPTQTPNQDERLYQGKIANFSKGLPHNNLGEVDPVAYDRLLAALSSGRSADYETIPMGGSVKLANPQSALAFQLEGGDSHSFAIPPFSPLASEALAGEMTEMYWHALALDVPFSQYGLESQTAAAINDLKTFQNYTTVNAGNLFRVGLPGDTTGPLVSQFLWQDVPCGPYSLQQRYKVPVAGDVHMTNYDQWLAIQRGTPAATSTRFDSTPRYIRNAHDLAEWVHKDFTFQAFQHAALILMGMNAQRDSNPYSNSTSQAGFITFGGPHILDLIARAAYAALKAAWHQKWQVHRSLRPEVLAGRVHNHMRGAANYPLHSALLNSKGAQQIFSRYGTHLLPQVYPEGSPTHPSYPSGHATIAGACATVLKAFFNESFVLNNSVVANDDGLSLLPYNSNALTVGGEINKLAGNIAIGRDYAGVHYRQDAIQGLLVGEKVALNLLSEAKLFLSETNVNFTLTRFSGQTVTF